VAGLQLPDNSLSLSQANLPDIARGCVFRNPETLGVGLSSRPDPSDPIFEVRKRDHAQRVRQAMRTLMRPSSAHEARLEAAQFLGEAGEPEAISALRNAYKNDSSPQVRAASAYALGMFRAQAEALKDPEQEEQVIDLLTNMVLTGQTGRRARPPVRTLRLLLAGLTLTFALLVAANLFLGGGSAPFVAIGGPASSPEATAARAFDPPTVVRELEALVARIDAESVALSERLLVISRGERMVCDDYQTGLQPYTLPPELAPGAFPRLAEAVAAINPPIEELLAIEATLARGCRTGQEVTAQQAGGQIDAIVEIRRGTGALQALLAVPGIAPTLTPSLTPTPSPTLTPSATPTATATPEPTLDAGRIQAQINALAAQLEAMSAIRGANALVRTYWVSVRDNNNAYGCSETLVLPADHTIPQEELDYAPVELAEALASFNLGLSLTRDSLELFRSQCPGNRFGATTIERGIEQVLAAEAAYTQTQLMLDLLRLKIR
jgi:uncharacterized protein (DUF2267 family)